MSEGIQKPNCLSCFIKEYDDGAISIRNNGIEMENEVWLNKDEIRFVREHLMTPVIAELERLSKQNVGTQYRYALEEAIALIRDGVKHE